MVNIQTEKCPRCEKSVYAAEQVMGPGRKFYHKGCLTCTECNRRLDSGALQEHNLKPYCRNCHRKLFSTQDLRHGNHLPETPKRIVSATFIPPTSSPATDPQSDLAPPTPEQPPAASSPKPISKPLSPNNTGSPSRFNFGGPRVECAKCQKAVYAAEQVLAAGKKWHRGCLQCASCHKTLDSRSLNDKEGEPYCQACYAKTHGPAGAGYALVGKR